MTGTDWPFGPQFRAARTRYGSLPAAAAAAGVGVSTWQKYENGGTTVAGRWVPLERPNPVQLYSVCIAADVDPAEAFAAVGLTEQQLAEIRRDENTPPVTVGVQMTPSGRAIATKYVQLSPERQQSVAQHVDDALAAQIAEEAQEET